MAIINFRGSMPVLNNATRITLAVPSLIPEGKEKWKVLWLLGEEGCSSDRYVRSSSIEALCEKYNIAVVMPEGLHSDYENMKRGLMWYDYLTDSLPAFIRETFPVSDLREDNYVFGFGMGGLGSLRHALRSPSSACVFGSCRSDFEIFSDDEDHRSSDFVHKMQTIYGDDYLSDEIKDQSNPYRLASSCAEKPQLFLYGSGSSHKKMASHLTALGYAPHVVTEEQNSGYDAPLKAFLDYISDRI